MSEKLTHVYLSGRLAIFIVEYREAVERNVAAPFLCQARQHANQFEADGFMAFGARWKSLSGNQRYLMGQAMLRVNDAIDPAVRDGVRAFV
jgi:hypothetical protein